MNVTYLIQPRGSGKTTKAMYEYMKDPANTIFVTHDMNTSKYVRSIVGGNFKNFISCDNFICSMRGRRPKNIILDDNHVETVNIVIVR